MKARCTSIGCRRARMRGSDKCFYCKRQSFRTPPQVAARQIARVTGDREAVE